MNLLATIPALVDVALVLAVDVSSSVSMDERHMQREAYAAALTDPQIARMILHSNVAIAYVEWSSTPRVLAPLRQVEDADDLAALAAVILRPERAVDAHYYGTTDIGDALRMSADLLERYPHARRIVSGDGEDNADTDMLALRAQMEARGVTVNGLPIIRGDEMTADLCTYYRERVATEDGFVILSEGWGDFADSLRMKLALEIAGEAGIYAASFSIGHTEKRTGC